MILTIFVFMRAFMNQVITKEISVVEPPARADNALQSRDLNLALALYSAVCEFDSTNNITGFGKHKLEFLLNELTNSNGPYISILKEIDVSSPHNTKAAIEALDRTI